MLKVNLANKQEILRLSLLVLSLLTSVVFVAKSFDRWSAIESPPAYSSQLQRVVPGKSLRWTWFGGGSIAPVVEAVGQRQELQDVDINADVDIDAISAQVGRLLAFPCFSSVISLRDGGGSLMEFCHKSSGTHVAAWQARAEDAPRQTDRSRRKHGGSDCPCTFSPSSGHGRAQAPEGPSSGGIPERRGGGNA